MSNDKTQVMNGLGIAGCIYVGVILVIAKSCGLITLPWVWVTAPLWGPLGFIAFVILLGTILTGLIKKATPSPTPGQKLRLA